MPPTPYHLYDETGIRDNYEVMKQAFAWSPGYRNFFAVKPCPNPTILRILKSMGSGMDCSSLGELMISERIGISWSDIMFTSNETPAADFQKAIDLDANVNFDDLTHIDFCLKHTGKLPRIGSFRYNPGSIKKGNVIIGKPEEAKFGITREQAFEGYARLKSLGIKEFGLHTMIASNEIDIEELVFGAQLVFDLAVELAKKLDITFSYMNIGGGFGIPYRPEQVPLDIAELGRRLHALYQIHVIDQGHPPVSIVTECGRYITGPSWQLITTAIHTKHTYRDYIGVDACMANLMRPGMYGAYHHITVMGKEDAPCDHIYDVVGGLCENNDKFAIQRALPEIVPGDILIIHDTGAHGHSMGFNYNAKLRSAEYLRKPDGSLQMIRRAETYDDYFCTLEGFWGDEWSKSKN